jgi:multisubunit Na+/H+ antiporter MnhE subunit
MDSSGNLLGWIQILVLGIWVGSVINSFYIRRIYSEIRKLNRVNQPVQRSTQFSAQSLFRILLILGYVACFLIGIYASALSVVQVYLKINDTEDSFEYYQSGLAMGLGITFLYFFYLILGSSKRLKKE